MFIRVCAGAAAVALSSFVHADSPKMLLYSVRPPGSILAQAPFARYSKLGQIYSGPSATAPLTAILEGGRPVVHASDDSPYLAIPAGLDRVTEIGFAGTYVAALDGDGNLVTWGSSNPQWTPSEPLRSLGFGYSATVAAVGYSGQVYAWNPQGQLPTTIQGGGYSQVALGLGWGVVVDLSGVASCFGINGASFPSISGVRGIEQVSAVSISSASAPRIAAVRQDGNIQSLTSSFAATGNFRKCAIAWGSGSTPRLLGLAADGGLHSWTWNTTALNWNATPSLVPGAYDDVAASGSSTNGATASYFAICAEDSDRNGEPDSVQIRRGEIPDVNGDLVDDRRQGAAALLDQDQDGVVDSTETSSISTHRHVSTGLAGYWIGPGRAGTLALDRVPPHAERLTRAVVYSNYGQFPSVAPQGVYSILLDPDGDGDPRDAVSLGEWSFSFNASGRVVIDLGEVYIGPPGSVFFHGCVHDIPRGNSSLNFAPVLFDNIPTFSTDPFAASRLRGRTWFAYGEAQDSMSELVRGATSADEPPFDTGWEGRWPILSVLWSDRSPSDCDSDGRLDGLVYQGTSSAIGRFRLDQDADGIIDSCEVDCDADGIIDSAAIAAGAVDCNRDGTPDSCETWPTVFEQSRPVPSFGNPAIFQVNGLPYPPAEVTVTIEAVADLGAATEGLIFEFESSPGVLLFGAGGADCPTTPDSAAFTYPVAEFQAALADGVLSIRLGATSLVDPNQCAQGFVRVRIQYAPELVDCDGNGIQDRCEHGVVDCNGNGVPDECELTNPLADTNANGVLDECELDCNRNGILDSSELVAHPELDCDQSGYIDACEMTDCNNNGLHDPCELLAGGVDCNGDGQIDSCQQLSDCDGDSLPDVCEQGDCDLDGIPDVCEILSGSTDKDADGLPDDCEYAHGDFDLDGVIGPADLAYLLSVWGLGGTGVGDLNGDSIVGAQDLSILLSRWG